MNNQIIKDTDLSFWNRLKNFFKSKFGKNKNELSNQNKIESSKLVEGETKIFREKMQNDSMLSKNKEYELKKFIAEIENNPNLFEKLSTDRLDKLINYYEKITTEKKNKIEKLKQL